MKKLILVGCVIAMLVSCNDNKHWEYKVVEAVGIRIGDQRAIVFGDQTSMLNEMGRDGWELVSTYTEVETVFPNFGNSEYVTGIRDNHRTYAINFVFKRHYVGKGGAAKKESAEEKRKKEHEKLFKALQEGETVTVHIGDEDE